MGQGKHGSKGEQHLRQTIGNAVPARKGKLKSEGKGDRRAGARLEFESRDDGLYAIWRKGEGKEARQVDEKRLTLTRLRVVGEARKESGLDWGLVVKIRDSEKARREVLLPRSWAHRRSNDLLEHLAKAGALVDVDLDT